MYNYSVGIKIKELRTKMNLTQQQLADIIGVSNKAVSKWENGEGLPDIENLKRVSNVFNTSIDELVSNKQKEIKLSKLNMGSITLHLFTVLLFFFPFIDINPVDTIKIIYMRLSGFQLIKEGLTRLQPLNILIGFSLLLILVNVVWHVYAIYKRDIKVFPDFLPLMSLIASGIILISLYMIKSSFTGLEYISIPFTSYLLIIVQAVQLYLFKKTNY